MDTRLTLLFVATWFVFGMARIVFTSAMVHYRIDRPDPSQAIAFTRAAAKARMHAPNYDAKRRTLLPWYRAVTVTYWAIVAGVVVSAVVGGST